MTFHRLDPDTGELVECGSRVVICITEGCGNAGIPIEVADDPGGVVVCGPCGTVLAHP